MSDSCHFTSPILTFERPLTPAFLLEKDTTFRRSTFKKLPFYLPAILFPLLIPLFLLFLEREKDQLITMDLRPAFFKPWNFLNNMSCLDNKDLDHDTSLTHSQTPPALFVSKWNELWFLLGFVVLLTAYGAYSTGGRKQQVRRLRLIPNCILCMCHIFRTVRVAW